MMPYQENYVLIKNSEAVNYYLLLQSPLHLASLQRWETATLSKT